LPGCWRSAGPCCRRRRERRFSRLGSSVRKAWRATRRADRVTVCCSARRAGQSMRLAEPHGLLGQPAIRRSTGFAFPARSDQARRQCTERFSDPHSLCAGARPSQVVEQAIEERIPMAVNVGEYLMQSGHRSLRCTRSSPFSRSELRSAADLQRVATGLRSVRPAG